MIIDLNIEIKAETKQKNTFATIVNLKIVIKKVNFHITNHKHRG